jgi:hypothetical protein
VAHVVEDDVQPGLGIGPIEPAQEGEKVGSRMAALARVALLAARL